MSEGLLFGFLGYWPEVGCPKSEVFLFGFPTLVFWYRGYMCIHFLFLLFKSPSVTFQIHTVDWGSRSPPFDKLRAGSLENLRIRTNLLLRSSVFRPRTPGSKNISLNPSSKRDLPAVLFYSLMTGRIYTSGAPLWGGAARRAEGVFFCTKLF